ncbi:DJ-1/PfpI family protein [Deinococcus misasensis]|uniref:DJ-1/PfpI family protein n=1 Tax=Deinococcus misasensis TaxID=392413 RepID=UPI00055792F4|nr:DJ-1/PfpI family protein [Deinococcus misasensis]
MKPILRTSLCVLAAVTVPFAAGQYGSMQAHAFLFSTAPQTQVPAVAPPVLNPALPTVVVALGADVSEVADVLVPFQVFAASGKFNVVTAAPKRRPVALTGGLDLLPHFSFAELDQALSKPPALVVIPNIPFIRKPENAPVLSWLKQQSQHPETLLLSICSGADTLALTGALDGKKATGHWSELDALADRFPEVQWIDNQRYLDEGQTITAAGVLSGLDASLHVLERLSGTSIMEKTARKLDFARSPFLKDPTMDPLKINASDSIFLLNASYLWDRPAYQLPLQNNMDEMDLAAVVDTYPATFSATLTTTAPGPVKTRYGLDLLPRASSSTLPILKLSGAGFPFDVALKQLAEDQNVPTAVFGAKRLEYRSGPETFGGAGWWIPAIQRPLMLAILGIVLVLLLEQLFLRRSPKVRL